MFYIVTGIGSIILVSACITRYIQWRERKYDKTDGAVRDWLNP